jgi:5-methylcytosine-specific restriction endonuclease McrA
LRRDIDNARDTIVQQVLAGVPHAVICAEYNCKPDTLKTRLREWGIADVNNMPGRGRPKHWARRSAREYLRADFVINVHRLKQKLWRDGLKPLQCEECGWAKRAQHGRLPLELHHISGDKSDNRLENLIILCPNCHSLKDNHRGLNKGKAKPNTNLREV